MIQTTVKVSGMACSMCEAHINDAIRAAFPVEKVSSSHSKGETVILSQAPLDENALRTAIDATGYTAGEISTAVYEKKGFFLFFLPSISAINILATLVSRSKAVLPLVSVCMPGTPPKITLPKGGSAHVALG